MLKLPKKKKGPAWTPKTIAELKRLVSMGHQVSHICVALGFTRSSVAHKIKRLGLRGDPDIAKVSHPGARPSELLVPCAVPPFSAAETPAEVFPSPQPGLISSEVIELPAWPWKRKAPMEEGMTLMELRASDCRYPFGNPKESTFHFCGRPRMSGAYCAEHAALCYQSEASRKWMNRKSTFIKRTA